MMPRNRSKWRSFLSSPFTLVAVLILIFFLGRAVWNIHDKADLSAERLEQARAELAKLEADETSLAQKSADLSTDAGVEREMREKYRAVLPGESVAVIVDGTRLVQPSGGSYSTSTQQKTGFWSGLLKLIGLM